jgi:hypothetical protein
MKPVLLPLFALVILASPNFAQASAGANTAQGPDRLIAQAFSGGGMPMPRVKCQMSELSIYASGKVIATRCKADSRLVATLSPSIIAKMTTLTETLKSSELAPLNPDAPECADAPMTAFSVFKKNAQSIEIGAVVNCREELPTQDPYAAELIRDLLKSMVSVSYL